MSSLIFRLEKKTLAIQRQESVLTLSEMFAGMSFMRMLHLGVSASKVEHFTKNRNSVLTLSEVFGVMSFMRRLHLDVNTSKVHNFTKNRNTRI